MLIKRIITAIILLLLMVVALFHFSAQYWAIFSALIFGLALWEFCAMAKMQAAAKWSYLAFSAVLAAAALYEGYRLGIVENAIVLVFWLLIVPLWLIKNWSLREGITSRLLGWLIFFPAWLAMLQWRPSEHDAKAFLSIVGIVWVADIGAFVTGKIFGKHKLAKNISPGKTWEGVAGAVFGAVCYALIMYRLDWVPVALPLVWIILLAILLALLSVMGDLLESMFKRGAGIKDSSNLLPGHGGVYDRVDSMVVVLAVSAALLSVVLYLR